ncbi:MAG: hypothetical protein ACRCTJ_04205 [Brevinema sp.]
MNNRFLIATACIISVISCSTAQQLRETSGISDNPNKPGNPEKINAFVKKFVSGYAPIAGAVVSIDNIYSIHIESCTKFKTHNTGTSIDKPVLVFNAHNPNATGDQIISIRMDENPLTDPKFEITSATTANFYLTFEMANGMTIDKEIAIKIIEDKLYLDKVAVGTKKAINYDIEFIKKVADKFSFKRRPLDPSNPEGEQTYNLMGGPFRPNGDHHDIISQRLQVTFEYAETENLAHYRTLHGWKPVTLEFIGADKWDGHVLRYINEDGCTNSWVLSDTPERNPDLTPDYNKEFISRVQDKYVFHRTINNGKPKYTAPLGMPFRPNGDLHDVYQQGFQITFEYAETENLAHYRTLHGWKPVTLEFISEDKFNKHAARYTHSNGKVYTYILSDFDEILDELTSIDPKDFLNSINGQYVFETALSDPSRPNSELIYIPLNTQFDAKGNLFGSDPYFQIFFDKQLNHSNAIYSNANGSEVRIAWKTNDNWQAVSYEIQYAKDKKRTFILSETPSFQLPREKFISNLAGKYIFERKLIGNKTVYIPWNGSFESNGDLLNTQDPQYHIKFTCLRDYKDGKYKFVNHNNYKPILRFMGKTDNFNNGIFDEFSYMLWKDSRSPIELVLSDDPNYRIDQRP